MFIMMPCTNCYVPTFPRVADSGLYYLKCVNCGQENNIVLQQQRFEVLAYIGMQALMDGYNREAVASFSASLERFMEFYIRVIARHHHIEDSAYQEIWKIVQSQSERQLGMFLGCYMMENSKHPPALSNRQRNFRNRVIHKGYIPKDEESLKFGQDIVDIIQPVIWEMRGKYDEALHAVTFDHQREALKGANAGAVTSYACYPMVYQFASGDPQETPNLQTLMARMREALLRWTAGPAAT